MKWSEMGVGKEEGKKGRDEEKKGISSKLHKLNKQILDK